MSRGGTLIKTTEQFSDWKADYIATKNSRFVRRRKGLAPQGASADYHFQSDYDYITLVEKSRDLDRNDALIGQMMDRAVANVVGDGFVLHPETGNAELDTYLWQKWQDWSTDPFACDIAQEFCWQDYEQLALRSMFVDGDVFIVAVEGPTGERSLQFVEGDQIQTPRGGTSSDIPTGNVVVLGVEMNQQRRKEAIHVLIRDPNPRVGTTPKSKRIPIFDEAGRRQVFQVYKPSRPTQARGVGILARVFEISGMAEDINFAALVQRQVSSCIAFIRTKPANGQGGPLPSTGIGSSGYGNEQTVTTSTGGTKLIDEVAPGMELEPPPGETVEGFSPQVPSPGFFEQMKYVLTLIGLNAGLPYVQLMLDASQTNFSGWRGAVSEARKNHRDNQHNLRNRLNKPVYQLKVAEWMETDPEVARLATGMTEQQVMAHRWNLPAARYIQPEIEAQADLLRVRNGLISPRRLHAEQQRDFEEIATETILDNSYAINKAIAAADQINEGHDPPIVHWRELLSLPTPDGTTISLQNSTSQQPQQTRTQSDDQQ